MKSSFQFWLLYAVAWLAYTICLGTVLFGVGNRFNTSFFLTILSNVLPAVLLGVGVVQICRKISWKPHKYITFVFTHLSLLFVFAASWCYLTLLCLSLQGFVQNGEWTFVKWDNFAVLWQFFSGVMAYLTIASTVYVSQMNERLQLELIRNNDLQMRAIKAEAARTQAELAALRAQLNPHFVFNTLHTLMTLVRIDTNMAEAAIERFALMLRYVLQSQNQKENGNADVSFKDEWDFVLNYLELERLRLGNRLKLETNISPDVFDCCLPAFSIQSLVENAIKHSISQRAKGGHLFISALINDEKLFIIVSNDMNKNAFHNTNSNGLGLHLIRESLMTRFGSDAAMTIDTFNENEFSVLLTLPIVRSINFKKEISLGESSIYENTSHRN